MSCVRIKRFRVFESKDFLCSTQKISCVRIRRFLVFESRDFLCSNQRIPCVPITTSLVFQSRHFLVPKHDNSSLKKSTRHFWPNFGERPGIPSNHNLMRKNPGTIAKIRPKVACEFFDILTSEKNFRNFVFEFFLFSNFFCFNFCCRAAAALLTLWPR